MIAERPHDLSAEQNVLGSMLMSAKVIADVLQVIRPQDYYRPAHQLVHEAIAELYTRGEPAEAATVANLLARHGDLDRAGGGPYLHTLLASVSTPASAPHYARIVAEMSERREWLALGDRIRQAAGNPGTELSTLRELAAHPPESSGGGLLAGVRTGSWLDEQEFPPLRWAVEGLIPEGSTLLIGAPKIGKSWFVLSVALAVASGGVALSAIKVGAARDVLYLALEDSDRRLQERCRQLLEGAGIPAGLNYLTRLDPARIMPTIEQWLRLHGGTQPLVIIDTLGKVMPSAVQGESAYQRDYRVGSELKRLCDAHPGTSLVVCHHERKAASSDFIDSVSGTHGLAGAADSIVLITRDRGDCGGLIQVTGRDVVEGEYAVTFTGGMWALDGIGLDEAASAARLRRERAGLSDRSTDVLAYVERQAKAVSAKDVARDLRIDNDTAGKYLRRLAEADRVRKQGRGLYISVRSVRTSESEGATFGQSDASDTVPGTATCEVCGEPLDSVLAAGGDTTHPACDPGGAP